MLRRYPVTMVRAFYSPSCYREVARSWRGYGISYLVLLTLLCTSAELIRPTLIFPLFIESELWPVMRQLPAIEIEAGRAKIFAQMPKVIVDPVSGSPLIILDTTGEIDSLTGTTVCCLVTETTFHWRTTASGDGYALDLGLLDGTAIAPSDYRFIANFWTVSVPILVFLVTFIVSTFVLAVVVAMVSVCGLLVAELMPRMDLRSSAIIRLTAIAVTPPWILCSVFVLVGLTIGFTIRCAIDFGLATFYLLVGLWANRTGAAG